jgi:hypothetical protein
MYSVLSWRAPHAPDSEAPHDDLRARRLEPRRDKADFSRLDRKELVASGSAGRHRGDQKPNNEIPMRWEKTGGFITHFPLLLPGLAGLILGQIGARLFRACLARGRNCGTRLKCDLFWIESLMTQLGSDRDTAYICQLIAAFVDAVSEPYVATRTVRAALRALPSR